MSRIEFSKQFRFSMEKQVKIIGSVLNEVNEKFGVVVNADWADF